MEEFLKYLVATLLVLSFIGGVFLFGIFPKIVGLLFGIVAIVGIIISIKKDIFD